MDGPINLTSEAKTTTSLLAPAKVNLFLRVVSRRPDGYHEISSLIQPVSLYDEVLLEVSSGENSGRITVACSDESVPKGPRNIAYRAAELFTEEAGLENTEISIRINKKIPVGAGLGGGSSDAASVLMGLNRLFDSPLTDTQLRGIGAKIGSDVPFFMFKSPCLAKGRGEVLTPIELPSYDYILINPGFEVSTRWVYTNLDLTRRPQNNILTVSVEPFNRPENIKEFLINDLEQVTISRYPEIAELKGLLLDAGASGSLMSGSGPTVFGVFAERETALKAFNTIIKALPSTKRVFLVKGI